MKKIVDLIIWVLTTLLEKLNSLNLNREIEDILTINNVLYKEDLKAYALEIVKDNKSYIIDILKAEAENKEITNHLKESMSGKQVKVLFTFEAVKDIFDSEIIYWSFA